MKHLACLALTLGLAAFVPAAVAQEHETKQAAGGEAAKGEHGGGMELWKWANFLVLAGGLGYLAAKNAGPYFSARSKEIRSAMVDAEKLLKESKATAADVERRLANLGTEIGALRAEAQKEAEAEAERLRQHTAAEIAKIQAHSQQEIVTAGKAARMELRQYSAELAIGLAEQKIRARMTPDSQRALVERFVQNLK
jgi:F-type H+-transporting ATPase subunit b